MTASSAARVLTELIAQHEDEWADLPEIKPGRCRFIAERLIAEGTFHGSAYSPHAEPERIATGARAIVERGERARTVTLSAEHWSYVREALSDYFDPSTVDGARTYELRYGSTHLRDALASITEQTKP